MITVERVPKDAWKAMSENAHLICFQAIRPQEMERIDFALLGTRNGAALGYVTCREMDSESLYWQYGGAFPGTKGSSLSFEGYQAFVSYCSKFYARIGTLIENKNVVMLKMAMKVGFRIVGVRNFKGQIFCELALEFDNG